MAARKANKSKPTNKARKVTRKKTSQASAARKKATTKKAARKSSAGKKSQKKAARKPAPNKATRKTAAKASEAEGSEAPKQADPGKRVDAEPTAPRQAAVDSRTGRDGDGRVPVAKKASNGQAPGSGTWKHPEKVARTSTRSPGNKPVSKPPKLDMDADVMEFIAAIDAYKREHHRPFPGWSEILHVIKKIGYRKPRK